jgi:hypothetical protein
MSLMLIALVLSRIPEARASPVRSRVLARMVPYANILAYLERIRARPAYQKAMAVADQSATA